MNSSEQTLRRYRDRVELALDSLLPARTVAPRLHEAMRYATLGGGKRVRACLVYAAGEASGVQLDALDPPACAVELVHAYSLVHDDLPCMDDDDLRRGRPTCHRAFDEATALLAGDGLQTRAFEVLADATALAPAVRVAMVQRLAYASGGVGMVGGQAIDLASVGKRLSLSELEDMHARKTGALIEAAVALGGLASGGKVPSLLEDYGRAVGLAFQIVDDILDIEGDTATLGKISGADQARNKPTYPALMGLEPAKAKAAELHRRALASLTPLGDNGAILAHLAHLIISRTH